MCACCIVHRRGAALHCVSSAGGVQICDLCATCRDMLPHPPMLSPTQSGGRCCWVGARERTYYVMGLCYGRDGRKGPHANLRGQEGVKVSNSRFPIYSHLDHPLPTSVNWGQLYIGPRRSGACITGLAKAGWLGLRWAYRRWGRVSRMECLPRLRQ